MILESRKHKKETPGLSILQREEVETKWRTVVHSADRGWAQSRADEAGGIHGPRYQKAGNLAESWFVHTQGRTPQCRVVREAESYIEISDVVQVSTKLLLYASGHHGKHECGFKYNI